MPEGPELHIASRMVNKVCFGRIFSGAVIKSDVSTKNPDVEWNEAAYVISARSRGKEIMLTLRSVDTEQVDTKKLKSAKKSESSDQLSKFKEKTMNVLIRFGMSGKFEYQRKDNMEKHSHLNFYTSDNESVLSFVDYRRFGRWEITSNWGRKRGPCIIVEPKEFRENVLGNLDKAVFKKPICEALLDQEYFNGMGNYLRAEVLYRKKIPPFASSLSVLEPIKDDEEKGIKVEEPDLLSLCTKLATEVINLNQGEGYFYDYTKEKKDFNNFVDWLQCYSKEGFKNLVDHNGRTIWFSGPAGSLAPKESKSRNVLKKTKERMKYEENTKHEKIETKKDKLTRKKLNMIKDVETTFEDNKNETSKPSTKQAKRAMNDLRRKDSLRRSKRLKPSV